MIHTYIYIHTMFGGPELHQFASARSRHPRDHHGGSHFVLGVWRRRQKDVGDWWFRHQTCCFLAKKKTVWSTELVWQKNWNDQKTWYDLVWWFELIWADLSWSFDIFGRVETIRNDQPVGDSMYFTIFRNDLKVPGDLMNCSMEWFFLHCHFGLSFQWARDSWVSGRLQVNNRQQSTFQSFVQSNPAWARAASISSVCGASLCEMIGKRYCVGSCSNNREFDMLCMHIHICTYMYIYVHYVLVSVYIHVYTDYISYMYSDVYICICTCK